MNLTITSAAILRILYEGEPRSAHNLATAALDSLFRAKLVELVPGHDQPWVRITESGKAAYDAWVSRMGHVAKDRGLRFSVREPLRDTLRRQRQEMKADGYIDRGPAIPCEAASALRKGEPCGRPTKGDRNDAGQPICTSHAIALRFRKLKQGRAA